MESKQNPVNITVEKQSDNYTLQQVKNLVDGLLDQINDKVILTQGDYESLVRTASRKECDITLDKRLDEINNRLSAIEDYMVNIFNILSKKKQHWWN